MQQLQNIIETAFERRAEITPANADTVTREAVNQVIALLDSGALRVAEKIDGQWVTHQWLKKAVLLSFRINDNQVIEGAESRYFDKVPMKFADYDEARFQKEGFRVVPPAAVRQGAFIARNTVLMPSYVNIGAYVDEGTMVDTWATVGSCAQIGKNVHLSGGVGIGGVLEPLQANPTIIEDNCFIGARSEVVEGVIVEEGSVISMAYTLVRAPVFTTVKPAKSTTVAFRRGLWLFQVICRRKMANTASTVRLSLRKLTRKLAAKSALTNCCVPSTKSMHTGSTTLPDCFLVQNNSSYSFFLPPFLNTFSSCFGLSCNSQNEDKCANPSHGISPQ
ncbi:2,3,4,5-tetrahydropyridine-2,6-carboxylate N-succinyltransferase [Escherichia coli]|nr:2,3,4,5-tetrahydropyridine-2,6-carboxylate N-succinyltransferase [Escherichia coli]